MNSDAYFEIGYGHTVCQDYAIAGKINDHIQYAIVCDGCSSSPNTDVGARLIAHHIVSFLKSTCPKTVVTLTEPYIDLIQQYFTNNLVRNAYLFTVQDFSLPLQSLDATILILLSDKFRTYHFMWGDGFCLIKYKNGSVQTHSRVFESGAPYYLSYLLSESRNNAYLAEYGKEMGNDFVIGLYYSEPSWSSRGRPPAQFTRTTVRKELLFVRPAVVEHSDEIDSITIGSDGLASYQNVPADVSFEDQLFDFVNYKNHTGVFVQRRVGWLKKQHQKVGITHFDDIALASIYVGGADETDCLPPA